MHQAKHPICIVTHILQSAAVDALFKKALSLRSVYTISGRQEGMHLYSLTILGCSTWCMQPHLDIYRQAGAGSIQMRHTANIAQSIILQPQNHVS